MFSFIRACFLCNMEWPLLCCFADSMWYSKVILSPSVSNKSTLRMSLTELKKRNKMKTIWKVWGFLCGVWFFFLSGILQWIADTVTANSHFILFLLIFPWLQCTLNKGCRAEMDSCSLLVAGEFSLLGAVTCQPNQL